MYKRRYAYFKTTMVDTEEIGSMVHCITQMTTKPIALDQFLQKTHFLFKKERLAIKVTDEKNFPMIGVT